MEKLDVELEVIKCKIHEEDLCESFKENLERKLNTRCEAKENVTSEKKNNIIRKPFCFYKAAAVFVCFVMFSSCAFAGGVGHWLRELFSNVDKGMEIAYENGDIKEVETEYQTFDGVSVKVDYVSLKDNELYIAFNINSKEECNTIDIKEFEMENGNSDAMFNSRNAFEYNNYDFNTIKKSIDSTNKMIFLTITKKDSNFTRDNDLIIKIRSIIIENDDKTVEYNGDWNYKINVNI